MVRKRKNIRHRRKSRANKREKFLFAAVVTAMALILATGIGLAVMEARSSGKEEAAVSREKYNPTRPQLDVELLTVNKYSRPGLALERVNGIVVHYTANPGTSARQNRDYFQSLAETKQTKASSHFIIGLKGEIVQCIPCSEIAYASNNRNGDTIAIECCIPGEDGKFNDKTYDALVQLVTWLMGRYHLTAEDVIRHYDVTGKNCPKYFVEHPSAWEKFRKDLDSYIKRFGVVRGSSRDPAVTETE